MTWSRFRSIWFAAVLVLIAAGRVTRQPLPTFQSLPQGVPPGSDLVEGRLVDNAGCVELVTDESGFPAIRMALLWEPGWSVTHGPLRVFDPAGTLVASEGQRVWVGGVSRAKGSGDPACPSADSFGVTWRSTTDPVIPS